ncbi:MAG: invasion associated locus B family protein [Alphaproteobacteria bacterium]|nr:invasion associated locus B family protein [Alphaproteobacteria bacterium]
MKITRFFSIVVLCSLALPAFAQEPRSIGSWRDWDAFVLGAGNSKICYIVSVPEKKLPTSVTHGTVYITVSHKPERKVKNEVNVVVPYSFRAGSEVRAIIGGRVEKMFTSGGEAWAYDPESDAELVQRMKQGVSMRIKGQSARGTDVTYEFSLYGFTAAYNAITRACS